MKENISGHHVVVRQLSRFSPGKNAPVHHRWRTGLSHKLFVLELVMGILAFPFGALLTVTTLGMPLSMLENSPFSSFVIPGVILCLVVGGSMLLAARMIWFEHSLAPQVAFASGCILLGWISVEALLIPGGLPIQIPFAIYALVVMRMAWLFHLQQRASEYSGE